MTETWLVIAALAAGTFALRITGIYFGERVPTRGRAAKALRAIPGSLIVALVTVSIASGDAAEWIAGGAAAVVATRTRNLPLTMVAGMVVVWLLRR